MPIATDSRLPVLVVGAGPTGLALALWLARLGVRIRIVDKSDDVAPVSRALGVHAELALHGDDMMLAAFGTGRDGGAFGLFGGRPRLRRRLLR